MGQLTYKKEGISVMVCTSFLHILDILCKKKDEMKLLNNNFYPFYLQYYNFLLNLHPQTESSVVVRRSCIYMIGVY